MMEKYNFPAYHCHHAEHVEALQGLRDIINAWNEHEDLEGLTVYVQITWPKWYIDHISTMDVVTSAFIKQSI